MWFQYNITFSILGSNIFNIRNMLQEPEIHTWIFNDKSCWPSHKQVIKHNTDQTIYIKYYQTIGCISKVILYKKIEILGLKSHNYLINSYTY